MIKSKIIPSADYLRECFEYCDGVLIWRNRPIEHFSSKRVQNMWNAKNAGKHAGRVMKSVYPYIQVGLDGKRYLAHRIIVALHGIELGEVVDHINGVGTDNRIENLRCASQSENTKNHSGWKKKSIRPGVFSKPGNKFTAAIRIDGKQVGLGVFDSIEKAICARVDAERRVYGKFAFSERGVVFGDERQAA